ncbi:MAG: pre-peptidase C-terminal domain-containing protein [Pseudomonadota bacterium]
MPRSIYLVVLLAVLGVSGCGGCGPDPEVTCDYRGTAYPAGKSFTADDGCNQCICSETKVIHCTSLVCPEPDAGVADSGPEDGGFIVVVDYPGTACVLESVDGEAPLGPPKTGQLLMLGDQGWDPPTPDATITVVNWSVQDAPVGTRVVIEADGRYRPDMVGPYVLRASIEDDQGGTAVQSCTLQVLPPTRLYVELVWNNNDTDVDLRMTKADADGKFCTDLSPVPAGFVSQNCDDSLECDYSNCKINTQGVRPDWDADQVSGSGGDPTLLFDVLTGYGPEAIGVDDPAPGSYLVVGHFFSAHGRLVHQSRIDLRVWADGQLRGSATLDLAENTWREALRFTWPDAGESFCIEALGQSSERCSDLPFCTPAPTCGECDTDGDCGPSSLCSTSLSRCLPRVQGCDGAEDCAGVLECIPATQVCTEPQCDGATLLCPDPRMGCDEALRACVLPPPVCDESDEPNNTMASATAVSGSTFDSALCRGDVDLLAVQGHANMRLRVTATFATTTSEHFNGDLLELLDASGNVLHRRTFGFEPAALVATDVAADATFYVRLTGVATGTDLAPYHLEVAEVAAFNCASELGEPNDTLEQSSNSILAVGTHDRVLCGDQDIDHHRIAIPLDQRLDLTVTVTDGFPEIVMLDVSGSVLHMEPLAPDGVCHFVSSARGQAKTVILQLHGGLGPDPSLDPVLAYNVEVVLGPAPTCSEMGEPNETQQQATPLTPGTHVGVMCDQDDRDVFALAVPAGGGIDVSLTFVDTEGDLELRVENAAGTVLASSATTANTEHVALSSLAAATYYIVVYAYSSSYPAPDAQPYSLAIVPVGWPDAGPGADASAEDVPTTDVGTPLDAGSAEDSFVVPDASSAMDSSSAPDAGTVDASEDASPGEDVAPTEDAG